jgi:hypothetical protein
MEHKGIEAQRHETSVNRRPDEQGFMNEEVKVNSQWK